MWGRGGGVVLVRGRGGMSGREFGVLAVNN